MSSMRVKMPETTAQRLRSLLQECMDVFYISYADPERFGNNFKAFVYALQYFPEDKIIMAFRTWQARGKKYPVPADIVDIIQKGSYLKGMTDVTAEDWPEWKHDLEKELGFAVVNSWFGTALRNGEVLSVKRPFFKQWIEQHYMPHLKKIGITTVQL